MNKERIAKWDNIKFFMMVSVVIGHTVYNYMGSSDLAKSIYLFIYTYHMPVFVFVAGLFAKHAIEKKKYERILEFLIIYCLMKFLDSVGEYILYGRSDFHLFWEDGPGWFALAMAVFLFVTMLIQRFDQRYIMGLALLIGCISGLDNHLGDHFASMRICVFYPVFLLGYYLDLKHLSLSSFSKKMRYAVAAIGVLFLNIELLLITSNLDSLYPFIKLLKGKYNYEEMGYGLNGVMYRLLCYVFWIIMISVIILVNLEMESWITWLGTRTMSIFIWHNIVITVLFKILGLKGIIKTNMPHYYIIVSICLAVIIAIITAYLPGIRVPAMAVDNEYYYDPETGERL